MHRRTLRYVCSALAAVAIATAGVDAQGGIRWPTSAIPLSARLVRTGAQTYDLYVSGWMTFSANGTDMDEEIGVGLGIDHGTTQVDESEFESEEDGEPMDSGNPLFPLAPSASLKTDLDALYPPHKWSGFFAKASRLIPGFQTGTLVFRLSGVRDYATLHRELSTARVAVFQSDASQRVLNNSRRAVFALPPPSRAPILYYHFDRGTGDFALNCTPYYAGGRRVSTLTSSTNAPWQAPGRFGAGLKGGKVGEHHGCDTGWKGPLHGDLTLAWFMSKANSPGNNVSRVFGRPGGLRCFTGGAAGKGLILEGWAGTANGIKLNRNIQDRVANRGAVHIGLVIGETAKRATWYIDGTAQPPIVINQGVRIPKSTSPLVIGGDANAANFYHLDEFRLFAGAVSPGTMLNMVRRSTAASPHHGTANGCAMRANGLPTAGTIGYELFGFGAPQTLFGYVLGVPAPVPYPIDGKLVYVNPVVVSMGGRTDAGGRFAMKFNVPTSPNLRGFPFYLQGFMPGGSGNILISNAIVLLIQ